MLRNGRWIPNFDGSYIYALEFYFDLLLLNIEGLSILIIKLLGQLVATDQRILDILINLGV